MIQLGLIGYPLGHSLSPKIHTAALKACGLEGSYSLFPIYPDDKHGLSNLIDHFRAGEIDGLNITVPYKLDIISFIDVLTDTAMSIGAVNTIFMHDDILIGHNTDADGFLIDLKKCMAQSSSPILGASSEANGGMGVDGKSAIVLGAGGSARAVIYALLNDGWSVTLTARRIEQAQELANEFASYNVQIASSFDLRPIDKFRAMPVPFDLLVNTTPVGMFPNMDASPLPNELSLPSNIFVYDLVYNPRETKLVRNARSQGLRATTGLGMLIEQAALSFEIWTGHTPPRDVLYASVVE
ncbi:MAG: shikimate dehydrogenase [Anaerolineales bacterium]|nr:shikimate dehydrogenase [Anaerolineales bacterium]WKZ41373.1 MAG: shikimate dehydrogenase [Anaerolineales bacterium]